MFTIMFLVFVLGLVIGSFLNVVIYRVPRGESIVYPNSHCPACGTFLSPLELIPIISFMMQKGQCKTCGTKISIRYPVIELLTGLLYVYAFWNFADSLWAVLFSLLFISLLIALAFIDLDTFRLPDVLVIPILIIGLGAAVLGIFNINLSESLLSALGAGGLFLVIAKVYPDGMGLGDVKLVASFGAFLGFPGTFWAVLIASLTGVLAGILGIFVKGRNLKEPIPFGPYLAIGAIVALFWGNSIPWM